MGACKGPVSAALSFCKEVSVEHFLGGWLSPCPPCLTFTPFDLSLPPVLPRAAGGLLGRFTSPKLCLIHTAGRVFLVSKEALDLEICQEKIQFTPIRFEWNKIPSGFLLFEPRQDHSLRRKQHWTTRIRIS